MIARSESAPCPVRVVESFIKKGKHKSTSRLFCKVMYTKNGFMLRDDPVTYSRANQLFKTEKLYGLHSLRFGGASAAAALGVPDRLFQRHGGWRSEKARNNYLKETLDSLLLVTK